MGAVRPGVGVERSVLRVLSSEAPAVWKGPGDDDSPTVRKLFSVVCPGGKCFLVNFLLAECGPLGLRAVLERNIYLTSFGSLFHLSHISSLRRLTPAPHSW